MREMKKNHPSGLKNYNVIEVVAQSAPKIRKFEIGDTLIYLSFLEKDN